MQQSRVNLEFIQRHHHHPSAAGAILGAICVHAALQAAILAAQGLHFKNLSAEQKGFGSRGWLRPRLWCAGVQSLTRTCGSNVLKMPPPSQKIKVALDQSTAETLTKLGIDMADAESVIKHAQVKVKKGGSSRSSRVGDAEPAHAGPRVEV